jgi:DNA topoisomerase-1
MANGHSGAARRQNATRLHMVGPEALVLTRRRAGKGFAYLDRRGRAVRNPQLLQRIRSLAIPPAYEDVKIARDPRAHLQAMGTDAAGRIQYRYHPEWAEVREARKVERLGAICAALPRIRRIVARDLRRPELCRRRVLAAVIALIDKTHVRIGCEDYVHTGRSRGAATLLKRNVQVSGETVALAFRGKGGRAIQCSVDSLTLARTIRDLEKQKGARLFRFRAEDGRLRNVTAGDVNAYLHELAGEKVTAKDFRTLAATAAAAEKLRGVERGGGAAARRRQLNAVMREIAEMLANTPAVTRKSYVHRRLVESFEQGALEACLTGDTSPRRGLTAGECIVATLFANGAANK